MLTKDALSAEVRGRLHEKKLCHNCDTKPAFAAQTDFFDRSHLLILWKLLKTQMCSIASRWISLASHPGLFTSTNMR